MRIIGITSLFLVCLASSANADNREFDKEVMVGSIKQCLAYKQKYTCEASQRFVEDYRVQYAKDDDFCRIMLELINGHIDSIMTFSSMDYTIGGDLLKNFESLAHHALVSIIDSCE